MWDTQDGPLCVSAVRSYDFLLWFARSLPCPVLLALSWVFPCFFMPITDHLPSVYVPCFVRDERTWTWDVQMRRGSRSSRRRRRRSSSSKQRAMEGWEEEEEEEEQQQQEEEEEQDDDDEEEDREQH